MMHGQNGIMESFGWVAGNGMLLGPLVMIGFWAFVIYVLVLGVRWLGGRTHSPPSLERSALDILKERYARGEIDEREFTERNNLLNK